MSASSGDGSRGASPAAIAMFLAPALVVYGGFTFYPVLRTFYNSVHLFKERTQEFVGFRNFLDILTQDPVFWKAVGNTATFTIVGGHGRYLGASGTYHAVQRPRGHGDGTATFTFDIQTPEA